MYIDLSKFDGNEGLNACTRTIGATASWIYAGKRGEIKRYASLGFQFSVVLKKKTWA